MSTKTIITSLVGVIIVGSIIYFTMKGKDPVAVTTEPVPVQIVKEETPQGETAVVGPTKNASTNEIIDYLIDGQSRDETTAAKATVDAIAPSPLQEPVTSTNF